MRARVLLSLATALLFILPLPAGDFVPGNDTNLKWVPFNPNYEELVKKRKPGILYIYSAKSLDMCKHFETELFADKGVKLVAKKFICIKVAGDDKPEIVKQFGLGQGETALVFVNIFGKVDDTLKEKTDADSFAKAMKAAADYAKKDVKKAKAVEKAYKKAEGYLKKKRVAEAVKYWEAIINEMGDLPHPLVAETKKRYEDMKKEGLARLKPALESGQQTANRYRNVGRGMGGTGAISSLKQAQNQVGQAVAKIKKILNEFPLSAVTEASASVLTELSQLYQTIAGEIARIEAEEEQRKQQQQQQQKK